MDFLEACKELISIDSSPSNGTGEVADFIKKLAESMGFSVRVEEEFHRGKREANILCFPDGESKEVHLMLQAHLDTEDPGSFALWERNGRNPFHAAIHGGQIYGLGASASKLDFLCKLYSVKKFLGIGFEKSLCVAGTFGEQYKMRGAVELVRQRKIIADRVLVSEPTNFDLVFAGKGVANIEITIPFSREEMELKKNHDLSEGQSTQCKMFKKNINQAGEPVGAVEKIIDYMSQLPDNILILEIDSGMSYNSLPSTGMIEFDMINPPGISVNQKIKIIYEEIIRLEKEFASYKDERFSPPVTTFNIGMIRTYDDHLKLMGCVHWLTSVPDKIYMGWMEKLKGACESLGAVFRIRDSKKPFAADPQSDFATTCLEAICSLNSSSQLSTHPVSSEANVFHKFGMETLILGPGSRSAKSQSSGESISLENLSKARSIYENIVEKICRPLS